MVIENIVAGIITIVIYGIIILGSIVPMIFIARTKHNIAKFGYKKYIFITAGLEVLLFLSAVVIFFLCTNSFYHSIVWNKKGVGLLGLEVDANLIIILYESMLLYILPVYLLVIMLAGVFKRWKVK